MARQKTITVEIDRFKALAILRSERENLGRIIVDYKDMDHLKFLIDDAIEEVSKWEEIYRTLVTK